MKIKLSEPILDREGKAVPAYPKGDAPTTVGLMAITAIDRCPDDRVSREEKYRRGVLADQIFSSRDGEIELEAKEVALLEDLVGMVFPPMMVRRFCDLVDPRGK